MPRGHLGQDRIDAHQSNRHRREQVMQMGLEDLR